MSDMADDFNAMRADSQERRARNREESAKILTDAGVQFLSRNGGAHLIVEHNGLTVHFWPGTGKWTEMMRKPFFAGIGPYRSGCGVFPLLKLLDVMVKIGHKKGPIT